jgi:hypothetical protein
MEDTGTDGRISWLMISRWTGIQIPTLKMGLKRRTACKIIIPAKVSHCWVVTTTPCPLKYNYSSLLQWPNFQDRRSTDKECSSTLMIRHHWQLQAGSYFTEGKKKNKEEKLTYYHKPQEGRVVFRFHWHPITCGMREASRVTPNRCLPQHQSQKRALK